MEDRQQRLPAGWCPWCGREIYPGERVWWLDGGAVHGDCLGEYALAHCPQGTLSPPGAKERKWRRME